DRDVPGIRCGLLEVARKVLADFLALGNGNGFRRLVRKRRPGECSREGASRIWRDSGVGPGVIKVDNPASTDSIGGARPAPSREVKGGAEGGDVGSVVVFRVL